MFKQHLIAHLSWVIAMIYKPVSKTVTSKHLYYHPKHLNKGKTHQEKSPEPFIFLSMIHIWTITHSFLWVAYSWQVCNMQRNTLLF